MNSLIEALQILSKYQKETYSPTHCEHDVLLVVDVAKDAPSETDLQRLDELGFRWISEFDCWGSFRFGSA